MWEHGNGIQKEESESVLLGRVVSFEISTVKTANSVPVNSVLPQNSDDSCPARINFLCGHHYRYHFHPLHDHIIVIHIK